MNKGFSFELRVVVNNPTLHRFEDALGDINQEFLKILDKYSGNKDVGLFLIGPKFLKDDK